MVAKFGALRREKRRGLAFYTGTSCLSLSDTSESKKKEYLFFTHCNSYFHSVMVDETNKLAGKLNKLQRV